MVIALVKDLIFITRLRELCATRGVNFESVRTTEQLSEKLLLSPDALVAIDCGVPNLDFSGISVIAKMPAIRLVGFFSHVDVETETKAKASGIRELYPRSRFFQKFQELISTT